LNPGTSAHFTSFESDFVDMNLNNYGQVETVNLRALLFIVASNTVLIEHEIFNSEKETTKVAMSKLWPVYYVLDIQMCFLSTGQILLSELRVENDKSSFTFYDKSGK